MNFFRLTKRCFPILICAPLFILGEIPEAVLKIMPPTNIIYHPVSTANLRAQSHFNEGLTQIFAYNHDIAYEEFEKSAREDPSLGMAYWGMALALGQNINEDVSKENELICYDLIKKALKLTSTASPNEQAYIAALATRYTNDPNADLIPLRFSYRDSMKKVTETYPEDLDAATLYAESILDLDPWKWWSPEGIPRGDTLQAIEMLESVLKRNPDHIGANHYYVHAIEESPFPERALLSAQKLETLLLDSGHLLHMPCHIFITVGDYESAVLTNKKAIAQDQAYIQQKGLSGKYPLHYLSHNLYVMTRIYMLLEDYPNAIKTASGLNQFLKPHFKENPHLAPYAYVPLETYLYFHKWREILEFQLLDSNPLVKTYWHFSRAFAYASLGEMDLMKKERELMKQSEQQVKETEEIANNPAKKIFLLADLMLEAAIDGNKKNYPEAIDHLTKAIAIQDELYYNEPPAWYIPARLTLGRILLDLERYQESERVFRKALKGLQRNGRLLFGLSLSLKGQDRITDAYWVEREMTAALKYASQPIKIEDL